MFYEKMTDSNFFTCGGWCQCFRQVGLKGGHVCVLRGFPARFVGVGVEVVWHLSCFRHADFPLRGETCGCGLIIRRHIKRKEP